MNDEFEGDLPVETAKKGVRPRSRPRQSQKPFGGKKHLLNVVKVRFKTSFITHEYDAQLLDLERGEWVIVETSKGPAMAQVASEVSRQVVPTSALKKVLRVATAEDARREDTHREREEEAFRFCLERVRERDLAMKLIQVQHIHDGSKAVFYFSAEGRVDFRDLVRDLANRFRTRIEMRQIGVRDGARMIGGIGSCGRELCCSTFLSQFAPVSIRMAKDQGLTLNPKKVSGMCGRLMCCLVYEQQIYRKALKRLPRAGKTVETPRGLGVIRNLDVVQEKVDVFLEDGGFEPFAVRDVVVLSARDLERRRAGPPPEPVVAEDHLSSALRELSTDEETAYIWEDGASAESAPAEGAAPRAARAPEGEGAAEEGAGRSRRRRGRRRKTEEGESAERPDAPAGAPAPAAAAGESSGEGEAERRGRRRRRSTRTVKGGVAAPAEAGGEAPAPSVEGESRRPARARRRRTGRPGSGEAGASAGPAAADGAPAPTAGADAASPASKRRRSRRRRPGGRGEGDEGGGGGGGGEAP